MPRPQAQPVLRRADYRPPAWLVPEIALDFDLGPERVRVRARLEAVRSGDHREPLRLDGEGLKLLALSVDGRPAAHKLDRHGLTIRLAADRAIVETVHEIALAAAPQTGLFSLGGTLCTQCEPEGFRRIAFFPDRPDILARFTATLRGDRRLFPILLANGNPAGAGEAEEGRHWARWEDPVPKPSYLFALVAGDLAAARGLFTTGAGREVALGIWTRPEDRARAAPVLAALKEAMAWDERAYGRCYDLEAFNIVALPDFAYGAMENKGLVLFDRALVLPDPEIASDADRETAATLVAHEYLHNWSGNRVTLRDWFQLGLKEGFTVLRDQDFRADADSAAVKRIEDVKALRAGQFAEDTGPRAHAVRPDSCAGIADLFTATVYVKGAEIVRMVRTAIGAEAFRAGCDLYFERHDGGAATCEDFIAALGAAAGADLSPFLLWYGRAGTPRVSARLAWAPERRQALLRLEQAVPSGAAPLPIPLALALFGAGGAKLAERLVRLDGAVAEIAFEDLDERPLLSINRGFSAPVIGDWGRGAEDLALLARCDDDPFARWEAMQGLMREALAPPGAGRNAAALVPAMRATLSDGTEPGLAAELLAFPSEAAVAQGMEQIDPAAIHWARLRLRAELGRALAPQWRAVLDRPGEDRDSPEGKGLRRLKAVALDYLVAGGGDGPASAFACYREAAGMTMREAALRALADCDAPERERALEDFRLRYRDRPAALDKWFAIQALAAREDVIELGAEIARPSRFLAGAAAGADRRLRLQPACAAPCLGARLSPARRRGSGAGRPRSARRRRPRRAARPLAPLRAKAGGADEGRARADPRRAGRFAGARRPRCRRFGLSRASLTKARVEGSFSEPFACFDGRLARMSGLRAL